MAEKLSWNIIPSTIPSLLRVPASSKLNRCNDQPWLFVHVSSSFKPLHLGLSSLTVVVLRSSQILVRILFSSDLRGPLLSCIILKHAKCRSIESTLCICSGCWWLDNMFSVAANVAPPSLHQDREIMMGVGNRVASVIMLTFPQRHFS